MPSGGEFPVAGPKVHCPFCAHDISFMKAAFGAQVYTEVAVSATTTFTAPVTAGVRLDDAVYGRDLQTLLWQRMQERAALYAGLPEPEMIAAAVGQRRQNREDGSVVMHLMFNRDIAPMGGLINKAVMGLTATQPPQLPDTSQETLRARGYALVPGDDGNLMRIQTVNDVPVGPLWNILQYWGGEKQHRRWHMARPINASPHRNDCPAFMDGKMCAVQVWLEDNERLHEALEWLCSYCVSGPNGTAAAGTVQAIMLG